jgi:type II secretory pathway component GspD/PulD (secretin)
MDDVPLTDAIRNLARQARLNYMLDPKIGFGQPGPDGKTPVPQPVVSIRWENITAEQALNALLNNYSLQIVEDAKSKIARVSVRDPAAPDPLVTKIIQLKYSSPSNILTSIQSTLTDKRSKVVADVRTSQLVVLATEKELEAVDQLVERLDTQTKQVLIEARLIETSINPSTVKGIDWSGTLESQHLAMGNNLQTTPVTSGSSVNRPLSTLWPKMMLDTAKGFNPATAFLDADGVNAVLSFINKNSEARVLSAPRAVTLDNETAMISVTRASPIINVTPGTANTTGGSQISYTNLGVILNVTPRISANNFVNLKVIPEVSRIFDTVHKNLGVSGVFEADEYDVRKIETRVMIPSGNTLVLGGLVQDDVREGNVKVPLLGDIPGIGLMFRHDSKSRSKANLLIFITPTIVQDEDFQPTKTDFLKSPVPTKDSVEGDWSAWDTGKPRDWSKKESDKSAGAGKESGSGVFAPIP